MTAVILHFPVKEPEADSFGDWQRQVRAEHPGWDSAKVDRVALLCVGLSARLTAEDFAPRSASR